MKQVVHIMKTSYRSSTNSKKGIRKQLLLLLFPLLFGFVFAIESNGIVANEFRSTVLLDE
jgi:hypothetical protein